MAANRTLDRSSVIRFTDINPAILDAKLEGGIYRDKFPVNFAHKLITDLWRARRVPDIECPRLKMRDVHVALGIGHSTLRKYIADGALGHVRYDTRANRLLSLRQFFLLAEKVGRAEWIPSEGPVL